ncbi:hypothetical protein GCM10009664_12610 [Kitasatospora gansuensis]
MTIDEPTDAEALCAPSTIETGRKAEAVARAAMRRIAGLDMGILLWEGTRVPLRDGTRVPWSDVRVRGVFTRRL